MINKIARRMGDSGQKVGEMMKLMFSRFSSGRAETGQGEATATISAGLWPRGDVTAALASRYGSLEHIRDENGFALYAINDRDVRFIVALVTAQGADDQVSEVGFMARFTGFNVGHPQLEGVNRNLHLSLAAIDTDGDIYLIGGVKAQGVFNAASFALVLESWRRDLALVIQAVTGASGGKSLIDAFPAANLEGVRAFANNVAASQVEAGGKPDLRAGNMLSHFMGAERMSFTTCEECGGRGKRGLIARFCGPCDGSGLIKSGR